MSFLDNTGLAYFYNKLKEKFIRSVNGETPDATGNVRINEVELAKNLTAPDAQASIDTFIYRTTGGSASLSSGEANLILINGNMEVEGRVAENVSLSTTNSLIAKVDDLVLLRTAVNNTTGSYTLNYTRPTSSEATTSWNPDLGSWTHNSESTSLASWGLEVDNLVAPSLSSSVSGTGITAANVVPNTFASIINYSSGTYSFAYIVEYDPESGEVPVVIDSYWSYNGNKITLSDYGITVTGTAVEEDTIAIIYINGTMNSSITISYYAPVQGTLKLAKPTKFLSTGFNQFDKDSTDVNQSAVINNATISGGKIISNSGTYVCYCKAVGGDHGYIAESIGGYINVNGGMGWCAEVPEIGSDVEVTSAAQDDSVTAYSADFTWLENGYMVVVVNNTSDLMMWCEWSGDVNGQEEYIAYVAPSEIDIPTIGYIDGASYNLPTASYGMPRLGTVYDTINFEAQTYIKRIERLAYSAGNLALVQNMDPVPVYDYDNTNIFYVLPTPVTYTFEGSDGIYYADDHGTEEFLGTIVPVVAETLYGQNLRDKLRTDVVTISALDLSNTQQKQVQKNINAGALVFTNTAINPIPSVLNSSVSGSITGVEVNKNTFESQITTTGEYIFTYNGSSWLLNSTSVVLGDYGITPEGTPAANDSIIINYTAIQSKFVSDSTYLDYQFKATINLNDVLANMVPQVIFGIEDINSGVFSPIVESFDGGIYIYANLPIISSIVIPTIICFRGNL